MGQRINGLKMLKLSGGSFLSMALAQWIGLSYSASAGVITLLSIQDTKRETIRVMVKRLISFFIALIIARVCFGLLGYKPLAVGGFLLIFAPICTRFQMQEGISVNTVLVTHFLSEGSMTGRLVINETLLLLVGAGAGVLLNLYIPGKQLRIRETQKRIESQFKAILEEIARALSGTPLSSGWEERIETLEQELEAGEKNAYEDMENNLWTETKYYISYMGLRKNQLAVLYRICSNVVKLNENPKQAEPVARLFSLIGWSFHESNNALGLLRELEEMKEYMKAQPLPAERMEFESRAILFQILLELELFLNLKRDFVQGLSEKEIRVYWKTEN